MGTLNREQSDQVPGVGCTRGDFLENITSSLGLKRMSRNLPRDEGGDSCKGQGCVCDIACCVRDRAQSSGMLEDGGRGVCGKVRSQKQREARARSAGVPG